MAKGENQKLKLLYLRDFLMETDSEHPLTMEEMLAMLKEHHVDAERKSIYSDIEALRTYGMDIALKKLGRTAAYYLNTREFEVNELKMLVDSIQAAPFLTEKKAQKLTQKVSAQSRRYRSELSQRRLDAPSRDHSQGDSLFRAIDTVFSAIAADVQIRFRYWHYGPDKKPRYDLDGKSYHVSPFSVLFESGHYSVLAYESRERRFRSFRLDRVSNLVLSRAGRIGKEAYSIYGLSDPKEETDGIRSVTLRCPAAALDAVIDRFGKGIAVTEQKDGSCTAEVRTDLSPAFFGWITSLGESVSIVSPADARNAYRQFLEIILLSD